MLTHDQAAKPATALRDHFEDAVTIAGDADWDAARQAFNLTRGPEPGRDRPAAIGGRSRRDRRRRPRQRSADRSAGLLAQRRPARIARRDGDREARADDRSTRRRRGRHGPGRGRCPLVGRDPEGGRARLHPASRVVAGDQRRRLLGRRRHRLARPQARAAGQPHQRGRDRHRRRRAADRRRRQRPGAVLGRTRRRRQLRARDRDRLRPDRAPRPLCGSALLPVRPRRRGPARLSRADRRRPPGRVDVDRADPAAPGPRGGPRDRAREVVRDRRGRVSR